LGFTALGNFLDFLADHYLLTSAAVLLAIAIALVEAKRAFKPWRDIGPFELSQAVNSGALLIDVRGDKPFREGHIAGARRSEVADVESALKNAAKEDAIVLYCETGSVSDKAAEKLALAGYRKVATLRGGLATWRTENLPLARP
jgi:rhodanese-related sulfurtransferase